MCLVNITEASLGSSNNGAIKQQKVWYRRDEVGEVGICQKGSIGSSGNKRKENAWLELTLEM